MMRFSLLSLFALFLCTQTPVLGNEARTPPKVDWSFKKAFGTYKRDELQRGFQVYKEVCATCHSMQHLRYEKLSALGFSPEEIKAIASNYEVPGPLNDEGEPTKKKAESKDFFAPPYANQKAARAANNGAYPVDLTLITKARKYGADYIQALMIGYEDAPSDFKLMTGMHYNVYFPGHQIAMPAPLAENQVTYADGTAATKLQMAHDIATFLSWAAEPEMEYRKQMGLKVLMYLAIFTALMFAMMRRVWKDVH